MLSEFAEVLYLSICGENCLSVQRTRPGFALQRRMVRGWYFLAVLYDPGSTFAQVSYSFLLLLYFSLWGLEKWCRLVLELHWLIEGILLPITLIGLSKSAMTLPLLC